MSVMKQTKLTLEQIQNILNGEENTHYPECFVMNQLGEFYLSEIEPNAENELAKYLDSEDVSKKEIAAAFLLVKKPILDENMKKISIFISGNNEIIDHIRTTIYKSEMRPWLKF